MKQAGPSRQLFETVNFAFMKIFDFLIKKFHKRKVDSLKKLSTRARLFYDFLHFRRCPFTKSQFSQGAINLGFQTKHILNP